MAATYSIAVIGDWESVMGFRALGLDTYPVTSVEEARKTVHDLAKTNCAVIYLTETLAKDMADVLDRYKDNIQPAIILIPAGKGLLASASRTSRAPSNGLWVRISCKDLKRGFHFAPSAHPIPVCFAPGNREPASKQPCLFRRRRRCGCFPFRFPLAGSQTGVAAQGGGSRKVLLFLL